jgi:hypothetical protein
MFVGFTFNIALRGFFVVVAFFFRGMTAATIMMGRGVLWA